MKYELCLADLCLPDYWRGHHLPHISVPVDKRTTFTQLRDMLRSEVLEGAVAGADYDVEDDEQHEALLAAVSNLRMKDPRRRCPFWHDLETNNDPDGYSVHGYFVFYPSTTT